MPSGRVASVGEYQLNPYPEKACDYDYDDYDADDVEDVHCHAPEEFGRHSCVGRNDNVGRPEEFRCDFTNELTAPLTFAGVHALRAGLLPRVDSSRVVSASLPRPAWKQTSAVGGRRPRSFIGRRGSGGEASDI